MRRALVLLALVACKQDVTLSTVEAQLSVAAPLVDVSALVDEQVEFTVRLDHLRGETAEILDVSLVNVQGDGFAFTGEVGLVLESGDAVELPFVYAPTEAGFDVGVIFIQTNARDGSFEVTARGRAALPELEAFPLALDFGPVAVGDSGSVEVRIDNAGTQDVSVGAMISDPRFSVVGGSPVTVPASGEITLPIRYEPVDSGVVSASLILAVGGQDFATISLRANDCENGTPSQYDADGDGVTGCSGDCDDTTSAVGPASFELPNGFDDNCDGRIDEGTAAYDDDGDGYCEGPTCSDGSTPGDCNDGEPAMNPGAVELDGNGLDDDCDGALEGGSTDGDGDGVAPPVDCDDALPTVFPGAPELVDGIDNDCDGTVDEGTAAYDDDGDGHCEGPTCADGSTPGDCDDSAAVTYPGAPELADWIDNDCDGLLDEGTANDDADGDGFTPAGGDCDDSDPGANPALGTCP